MKKVIISAGLLAIGVMAARDARSQESSPGGDKPWTLSGTLKGFYDDNYNTQPSGPLKAKSFGVDVSPNISVNYAEGPNSISAAYYYQLHYYFARPGHQVDQDHRFEMAFKHRFDATDYINVLDSFVDSQEPAILNGGTISAPLRANGDNYHNAFDVDYHQQINTLLGFVIAYNNNWYHYTGNNQDAQAGQPSYQALLNRFEHGITFDSRWTLTPQTTLVLGYQFGLTAHTSGGSIQAVNQSYVAASTRNFMSHSGYVGLDHEFTANWQGTVRVGLEASDFYNSKEVPANSSYSSTPDGFSPYVDLATTYKYADGGSVSLGFHDAQNTTDAIATYNQVSETVYGSVSQVLKPISPNLTAILTGQFQNSDYNGGTDNNGNDKDYSVGLNLAYTFTSYLSSEIGYNYDKLTSTTAGRTYSRNRVYIGVTATY